jgi:hypothetical protein
MKIILIIACLLGIAMPAAAAKAKKDALAQTATIEGITMNTTEPCRTDLRVRHDPGHKHDDEWPVEKDDRFAIEKRNGKKNYIDVKLDPFNLIQDPNMYVFNKGTPTLYGDYCDTGGDISTRPYAFGIHEIGDSQHPAELHALLHLPMRLSNQTSELRANTFYLFVFSIPVDSTLCDSQQSEDKTNREIDNDWRQRCHALRRLVIARASGNEDVYIQAIANEILNILPASPNKDQKFHNGVIHGNF